MKIFKKFFALVFATLLFASQSGMAFNLHYCKGALAAITFGETIEVCDLDKPIAAEADSACCKETPSESHKKCCKDSNIDLDQISKADIITKALSFEFSAFYLPTTVYTVMQFVDVVEVKTLGFYLFNFASNAPPLYKLYCKYILYA
ncbi:hypothetical protein K5I29_08815 [Flavobacterium agricola]|uniref:Secreted protein n=1 Tax=Flavobacterium agricola TaxID=2870839 RepID=A0ABY6LZ04_9FLAO|nr:hypothetical protein [Flavobacterium agricola]UYW00639.1 hypothetical protein K5I29_08815 [Flavobacterium agricola]